MSSVYYSRNAFWYNASFRMRAESIPQGYGIHSAGLRNPFRTHTEYVPQPSGISANCNAGIIMIYMCVSFVMLS